MFEYASWRDCAGRIAFLQFFIRLHAQHVAPGAADVEFSVGDDGGGLAGEIREVQSNKLFQADFIIQSSHSQDIISRTTTLLYRPDSPPGSLDGGIGLSR